jgi:(p)ppGpp synthase/HD superfamily hydrolase
MSSLCFNGRMMLLTILPGGSKRERLKENKKVNALVKKALNFATEAHAGQVRKYTGNPYIVHPIEVMNIVQTVVHDDEMLAAALLHDVVEDTEHTIEDICEDGNRKFRKAMDREHSAKSSPRAQTVKLADLISNSADIMKNDPKFAKVYLEEKRLLLEVLVFGDKSLYARAETFV